MVTAELAVGLLAAALAAVFACWTVSLVVLQTRCEEVAGQVARQLARGDQGAADRARGRAPQGARVDITRADGTVRVQVDVDSSLGAVGPVHLRGAAVADLEPGEQ
ncbi:TadE family type IV pilus minor pilin [Luteococcus peritonei]|uniref:TadE family type IV pilus minor pilin n=1 Tax=Luteococcus peritonei TaxID=88874 RepID=A0ABW4RWQ4_9ACTN